MPTLTAAEDRHAFPWGVGLAAALGWVLIVAGLQWQNPRLVPSWHGFLHAAIAERAPLSRFTPENPFFAGERLPYYWVYHRIAGEISSAAGVSSLAVLHGLALLSLAVLVLCAADLGRKLTGRVAAGLLIGFLALAGANPLGPAIAAAHAATGRSLLHDQALQTETVFVSDADADRMMSRPLLGALYFGSDWRNGQNIVWFWDISSRAPALAALMAALWATVSGRRWAVVLASLVTTAMNPVVGLAVAVCLACALSVLGAPEDRRTRVVSGVALAAGAALAIPTFLHLFEYSGATGLSRGRWILLKSVSLSLTYGLLALLAAVAAWRARGSVSGYARAFAVAGSGLLGLAILVALAEGNEHNLANAAGVMLAVPAGAAPWYVGTPGASVWRPRRLAWMMTLAFLPMTAATWIAFDGRPPLPFRYVPRLERQPAGDPVSRLHFWIRHETPVDAVLIADPERPIKMSGNVSELPAFTGRALFVDQASYLTQPYGQAFEERRRIAIAILRGQPLSPEARRLLQALGRPVYLVAGEPSAMPTLQARYGPPAVAVDGFAVFGPISLGDRALDPRVPGESKGNKKSAVRLTSAGEVAPIAFRGRRHLARPLLSWSPQG